MSKLDDWMANWALVAVVFAGCAHACSAAPELMHRMPSHSLAGTNREATVLALHEAQDWLDAKGTCPAPTDMPTSELATDAYGTRFDIRCARGVAFVRSAGEDGKFGTADDVDGAAPWR